MLPDSYGSDEDYAAAHGNAEWSVDEVPEDWCREHAQRGSTCGPCHAAGVLPTVTDEQWAACRAAVEKLRHLADSDEDTGAGLAALFEGEMK